MTSGKTQTRMGVYSIAPSIYQRSTQFNFLDDALLTPPCHRILADGAQDDLSDRERATKRRRILALADNILHGRLPLISSAATGGPVLRENVARLIEERDLEWHEVPKVDVSAADWDDNIGDMWSVLRSVRAKRPRNLLSRITEPSPAGGQEGRCMTAVPLGFTQSAISPVVDETEYKSRAISQIALRKQEGCKVRLSSKHRDKMTSALGSSPSARPRNAHKARKLQARAPQLMLTSSFKHSKTDVSKPAYKCDEGNEDRDVESAQCQANNVRSHVLNRKSLSKQGVAGVNPSSPFIYHKRNPAANGPTAKTSTPMADTSKQQDAVDPESPSHGALRSNKCRPLVEAHLNKLLPVSPESGRASKSVVSALRRELQTTGAELSSLISQRTSDVGQLVDVPAQQESKPRSDAITTQWPDTQALIAQAQEELFNTTMDNTMLPQQRSSINDNGTSLVQVEQKPRTYASLDAVDTQDLMNAWIPWSAEDRKRHRGSTHRGRISSPTVNPIHILRDASHVGDHSEHRSSKQLSLHLSNGNNVDTTNDMNSFAITATGQSAWTPVNGHSAASKPPRTTTPDLTKNSLCLLDFSMQAAQAESQDMTVHEQQMDGLITELADDVFGSAMIS